MIHFSRTLEPDSTGKGLFPIIPNNSTSVKDKYNSSSWRNFGQSKRNSEQKSCDGPCLWLLSIADIISELWWDLVDIQLGILQQADIGNLQLLWKVQRWWVLSSRLLISSPLPIFFDQFFALDSLPNLGLKGAGIRSGSLASRDSPTEGHERLPRVSSMDGDQWEDCKSNNSLIMARYTQNRGTDRIEPIMTWESR